MTRRNFGLTWWGQRWIGALEALSASYANRLPRGRTYARKGLVTDLAVEPGRVSASVWGTRAEPYQVVIALPTFDDDTWMAIFAALAGQVRHAAELLEGRMPPDVDDVLAEAGVSLFPRGRELSTTCSCPDFANPCKHVAAVHYVLADAFDADPFLLPALRGRHRASLLAGLRAARAGGALEADVADDSAAVSLGELSPKTLWHSPGGLADIRVRPAPPREPAAILHRLGPPPGLLGAGIAEFVLEDVIADAAAVAWRMVSDDRSENAT